MTVFEVFLELLKCSLVKKMNDVSFLEDFEKNNVVFKAKYEMRCGLFDDYIHSKEV